MPEPIVFISHFRIKEGRYEQLVQRASEMTALIREQKPQTVVFLSYVNEARTTFSVVHIFSDQDAADLHWEGAAERSKVAYENLEPAGWEIYGALSARALEVIRALASSAGVPLVLETDNLGGFVRLDRSDHESDR